MPTAIQSVEQFSPQVLRSAVPVLVEFSAPWCGYCRRLAPAFAQLADALSDKLSACQLNIDDLPELARQYQVDTIPTLLLFRDGQSGPPLVNPASQAEIRAWLRGQGI